MNVEPTAVRKNILCILRIDVAHCGKMTCIHATNVEPTGQLQKNILCILRIDVAHCGSMACINAMNVEPTAVQKYPVHPCYNLRK